MIVHGVHHVALTVTDLPRSRRFYGEVLGLREQPRPPFDFDGAWYDAGSCQLHLIVHPATRTLRGTTEIDSRDSHLALRVDEFHSALSHLRRHGIACVEHFHNRTPWAQIYVTDPDGHVLELNAERHG